VLHREHLVVQFMPEMECLVVLLALPQGKLQTGLFRKIILITAIYIWVSLIFILRMGIYL